MNELEEKLIWARHNQPDLYELIVEIKRLIRSNSINSIYTNLSNETFLAFFVQEPSINKILFNTLQLKHFKEWEGFKKIKILNKLPENIKISHYDLLQIDCNHFVDDWKLFFCNNIYPDCNFVILNNTNQVDKKKRNEIIKSVYFQNFYIHKKFDRYNGCIILTNEKIG